jgi:hypothetical protein
MPEKPTNTHPGPQKVIKRGWLSTIALRILASVFGFIMVHAFIRKNFDYHSFSLTFLWNLEFMSLDQATTIFVALLSTIIVREQYVESVTPYITYSCNQSSKPLIDLNEADEDELFWNSSFRNDGNGRALIESITYGIEFLDGSAFSSISSFDELVDILKSRGLNNGLNCWVAYFSNGGSIRPEYDYPVFTAPLSCARRIRSLDVTMVYKNILGDVFEKNIYCIPRIGIEYYVGFRKNNTKPSGK